MPVQLLKLLGIRDFNLLAELSARVAHARILPRREDRGNGIDSRPGDCDAWGMKKPKPPKNADFAQLARAVVEAATNETDDPPESAAIVRGRLGGLKGGNARAQTLTKAQRLEIAKKAAAKRWGDKKKRRP